MTINSTVVLPKWGTGVGSGLHLYLVATHVTATGCHNVDALALQLHWMHLPLDVTSPVHDIPGNLKINQNALCEQYP